MRFVCAVQIPFIFTSVFDEEPTNELSLYDLIVGSGQSTGVNQLVDYTQRLIEAHRRQKQRRAAHNESRRNVKLEAFFDGDCKTPTFAMETISIDIGSIIDTVECNACLVIAAATAASAVAVFVPGCVCASLVVYTRSTVCYIYDPQPDFRSAYYPISDSFQQPFDNHSLTNLIAVYCR